MGTTTPVKSEYNLFQKLSPSFRWPKSATILSIMSGPLVGSYTSFLASKPLFITEQLHFTENLGMFFFHVPEGLKLIGGLVAAILADSYIGKFSVIATSYIMQCILVWPVYLLSSLTFSMNLQRCFYLTAIILEICCSFGSTLHMPFISEQFKMPQEEAALQRYYVYDYIYLNLCTIIFTTCIIELVNCVYCFGSKCYLIIVGFCYIFSISYAFAFVMMKKWYRIIIPTKNPIAQSLHCLWYAIRQRINGPKRSSVNHFLDYAQDKYGRKTISDIKRIFNILAVIGIFSIYSMLYHQLESKWVYQVNQMNRNFAFWVIKPEQVEILNPLMVVILAPVLEHKIFPIAAKFNTLTTSLQKMGLSYFLTSVAFILAGILQYTIDQNLTRYTTKEGFGQVRFINCEMYALSLKFGQLLFTLKPLKMHVRIDIPVNGNTTAVLKTIVADNSTHNWIKDIDIIEQRSITYLLVNDTAFKIDPPTVITKNTTRNPVLFIYCSILCNDTIRIKQGSYLENVNPPEQGKSTSVELKDDNVFSISYSDIVLTTETVNVAYGAIYACVIYKGSQGQPEIKRFTYYDPYKLHFIWIIPQYFLISVAEVIQYVGMSIFIYTQSPLTMRSVVRALFTTSHSVAHFSIGALSLFQISSYIWYFSLACVLLLATVVHIMYATRYKYQIPQD